MYIARQWESGVTEYFIRESYPEEGSYKHRDLMALGPSPSVYINYPMGRSFFIDEAVTDILYKIKGKIDYDAIEEIFWPYIRADVKRRYQFARSRGETQNPRAANAFSHNIFDKKRYLYLKTGNRDQKKIYDINEKYFSRLDYKSRDEIEQLFMNMEDGLQKYEIKNYIYVIFDLQRHFSSLVARHMPEAINIEDMEKYFINEICMVNKDNSEWGNAYTENFINEYLKRYVIMFFDNDFEDNDFLRAQEFEELNRRRFYRQTSRPVDETYKEASKIFGINESELKTMSRQQLQRIFRKKARKLHPDKGGNHEEFVALRKVYDELNLKKKSSKF